MNPVLSEILTTKEVTDAAGNRYPLRAHLSAEGGAFLQGLIRELRPRRTLEIGLAYGISTLYMMEALAELPDAHHTIIDPNQAGWHNIGLLNVERAGYRGMMTHIAKPSHLALPTLVAEGAKFDLAFVDGDHHFDFVLVDFFYIDLLLRDGGVIVFDDTRHYPSIRKALRYIVRNRAYSVYGTSQPLTARRHRRLTRSLLGIGLRGLASMPGIRTLLKSEYRVRDQALGLTPGTRCTALRKLHDDDRAARVMARIETATDWRTIVDAEFVEF